MVIIFFLGVFIIVGFFLMIFILRIVICGWLMIGVLNNILNVLKLVIVNVFLLILLGISLLICVFFVNELIVMVSLLRFKWLVLCIMGIIKFLLFCEIVMFILICFLYRMLYLFIEIFIWG